MSAPVTLERKSGWCAEAVGGVVANWLVDAGLGGRRGWMFIDRATDSKSVGWLLTNASSRNMAMAEIRVTSGWVKVWWDLRKQGGHAVAEAVCERVLSGGGQVGVDFARAREGVPGTKHHVEDVRELRGEELH